MTNFFRNIKYFWKLDFSLLYEMQHNANVLHQEKRRIEQEMRYLHSKKDRENNFEKKAKISIKVQRWYRETEFSNEKVKEAEQIQIYLNQVFNKAEMLEQEKFETKGPEVVITPEVKQPITGLGGTMR